MSGANFSVNEALSAMRDLERAIWSSADTEHRPTSSWSGMDTDLRKMTVDLLQEGAYQAALAATARVMQPSLVDFLR